MDLPEWMSAMQLTEYNKPYEYRIDSVRTPRIQTPFDLIVKVATASYCHTDSMVQQGLFGTRLPVVPLHEGAGTIVAVGDQASRNGWHVGDRIMCGLQLGACLECEDCTMPVNCQQYCSSREGAAGITTDGFLAQYARCDSRTATRIPLNLSFLDAAPLACAGRTIWRAINLASEAEFAGRTLALLGSGGGLGHIGIQFGRAIGMDIIGVDARDEALELTQRLGVKATIDARGEHRAVVKKVHAITQGKGADSTVCITDHPSGARLACAITRQHGTVIQVAQPEEVSIPFRELIFRDIRLRGSLLASPQESEAMVKCVVRENVKVQTVLFRGFEDVGRLTETVHGGKLVGKAVVVIDKSQIGEEERPRI